MTEQQKARINSLVQRHLQSETAATDVDANVLLEVCELIRRGLGGDFMMCIKEPLKHGVPVQQHKAITMVDQVVRNTSDTFLVTLSTDDWTERFFRVCKTTTDAAVTERVIQLVIRWSRRTTGMRRLCERMSKSKVLGDAYAKHRAIFEAEEYEKRQAQQEQAQQQRQLGGQSQYQDPTAPSVASGGSAMSSNAPGSPQAPHHAREAMLNIDTFLLEVQGDMAGLEYGIQNPDVLDPSIVEDCAKHRKRLSNVINNNQTLQSDVKHTILLLLEQITNLLSFHDAIYDTNFSGQGEVGNATPQTDDTPSAASPATAALPRGRAPPPAAAPVVVGASGVDAAERMQIEMQMQELQQELAKSQKAHADMQAKYKDAKAKNKKAIETIEELEAEKDAAEAKAAAGGGKAKVVTKEKIVKVKPTVSASVLKAIPARIEALRKAAKELKKTGQSLKIENERFAADLKNGVAKLGGSVGAEAEKDKKALHALQELYKREVRLRKQYYNQIQELKGNIRVYCRIRPMSETEKKNGHSDVTNYPTEDEVTIVDDRGRTKGFEFDAIFRPESSQAEVFEDTKPLIDSVVDGYNVCIFAYGQTGSGKTHTMTGSKEQPGINSRALIRLFEILKERSQTEKSTVHASVLEIYNENIRDLLVPKAEAAKASYDIRTGGKYGHFVTNLSETEVKTPTEIEAIMAKAVLNRSQAATNMNQYSSRSHMIVYIIVKTTNLTTQAQSFGKLSLVDLAGSERLDKSGAEGQAAKEAAAINKSLTALGDTIAALSQSAKHVPYRNSSLTHLLQDSMAGNAKVLMFCCASPASYNAQETSSSLMFATRARGVSLGQAKKN